MRRLMRFFAACGVALAVSGAVFAEQEKPAANRPHVVLLVADDLGSYDVSWRGSPIKTPALDSLALAGAQLEQFYVQPVCSPTRAALMTGRYPMRQGLQVGVVRPTDTHGLPLSERTLPQALREAGYATAICGKWHLGSHDRAFWPTQRGFERQYGHLFGALDYFTHQRDGKFDWYRNGEVCRDQGYSTHLLAREAVKIVTEHPPKKPLFLYVPFNAVHAPHQVPPKYTEPYGNLKGTRRTYAGMVAALDEAVGQIVEALEARGMFENTLFIFTSDNGGPSPGQVTNNGPLRAGKGTLYEGGVRVAAFAAWQGKIAPGTKVNAPLHVVDWYPTLLRLAGASLEQKLPLDGRDIWPCLTSGAPSPHDFILLNAAPSGGALRSGDWKLLVALAADDEQAGEDEAPSRSAQRSIKRSKARDPVELYNLATDVGEKHNVAAEHPEVVAKLKARYLELAGQAVPPKQGK